MDKSFFSKINSHSLAAFRQFLAIKGASHKSIKRKESSLRRFLDWTVKEGYIRENLFETSKKIYDLRFTIYGKQFKNPLSYLKSLFLNHKSPFPLRAYRALPYLTYFNFVILIVFGVALGWGVHQQFFAKPQTPLAYPNAPVSPNRYLSFQGRLTNASDTPIDDATNMRFRLYDAAGTGNPPTGGTVLWDSSPNYPTGACSIDPDQNGIFSTILGSTCGGAIPSSVFTENADVWLGVTAGTDSEAYPRIQIATVAYALNAETLQGFPLGSETNVNYLATMGATARTIPGINPAGNLVIAAASPTIWSTSGTFAIRGQALSIITDTGTNGNITLAPDGSGVLSLTFSSLDTGNAINAEAAQLGTSGGKEANTLYYGKVESGSSNYNLLKLESGSSPTPKFTVDYAGNASAAGALRANTTGSYFTGDITVSGGGITGTSGNINIGETDPNYIISSTGFAVGGTNTYYFNSSGTLNAAAINAFNLAGNMTVNQDVDIIPAGTTGTNDLGSSAYPWDNLYAVNATLSGTLSLGPQTEAYAGVCNATTNEGKMYYDGEQSKYYYCDGSSWTEMGAGATSLWTDQGSYIYPNTTTGGYFRINDDSSIAHSSTVGTSGTAYDLAANSLDTGKVLSLSSTSITSGDVLYLANNTANNAYLIRAQAGSSLTNRLTLDSSGSLKVYDTSGSSYLNLSQSGADSSITSTGTLNLGSGGGNVLIGEVGSSVNIHFDESGNIEASADKVITMTDIGTITPDATKTYNLGSSDLQWDYLYAQDATLSGTLSLAPQTEAYAGICNATTNEGKMYYDAGQDKYYYCDGSSWTEIGGGASLWTDQTTYIDPTTITSGSFRIYDDSGLAIGYAYDPGQDNVIISGNVGIGTTSPSTKLDVNGNLNVSGYATASGSLAVGYSSVLAGVGNAAFSGKVGIGTSNPLYSLDVANSAQFDNYVYFAGGTTYYIDSSGHANLNNITGAGTLDINGGGTHDIAGTLNLSGNALTSTGDLTITPSGGDISIAGNIIPSAGNTYDLGSSGAYWNNLYATNIYSGSSGTQGFWTKNTGLLYPNNTYESVAIGGISTTSAQLYFEGTTGNASMSGNLTLAGGGTIGATDMNNLTIGNSSTQNIIINPNGNVGIGTTNPQAKLDVVTSIRITSATNPTKYSTISVEPTNGNLTLTSDSAGWLIMSGPLQVNDNWLVSNDWGTTYLKLSGSNVLLGGNVGIGTTNPSTTLDVSGNATVSGYLGYGPNARAYAGTTCDATTEGRQYYDGTDDKMYYCNGSSWITMGTSSSVSGSGTQHYLTKWSGSSTLTDAILYQDAGNTQLNIAGNLNVSGYATASASLAVGYSSILEGVGNAAFAGKVGIGMTNPAYALDVASAAQFDNAVYFQGSTTYYVDASGNAKFLDLVAADINNPGLTVGNGTTGYALIGGSTISDASGNLTLDSDTSYVAIADDLLITGNDIYDSTPTQRINLGDTTTLYNTTTTLSGTTTLTASTLATMDTAASVAWDTTSLTLGGSATLYGGSASSGTLTLVSTSDSTKGKIQFFSASNTLDSLGNLTLAGYATASGSLAVGYSSVLAGSGNAAFKGSVGIGTTNPQAPLHVIGDLYVSDGLSLYENAVSDGTVEAIKFCTGDGETNCVTDFSAVGVNYWTQANGTLYPNISSLDLLIGGTSTSSAKFAFTNMLTGTPTATFSGNLVLASTAGTTRTIGATNMNPLQIGTATTGDLQFYSSSNKITSAGALTLASTITANTTDTINGLSINAASITDAVNLNMTGYATSSSSLAVGYSSVLAGSGNAAFAGSVGIGTSNPGVKLDVVGGNIRGDGDIYTGDLYLGYDDTSPTITTNDTENLTIDPASTGDIFFNGATYYLDDSSLAYFSGLATTGYTPTAGEIRADVFRDGNSSYYLQPADTSIAGVFAGKVGIGTTNPSTTLDVSGNATVSGYLGYGPNARAYAGTTCDATTKGRQYYDGTDNKMYYCNGSSWTEMGGGGSSLWEDHTTYIDPTTLSGGTFQVYDNGSLSFSSTTISSGNMLYLANNTANNVNLLHIEAGASLSDRLTLDSSGNLRIYDTNGTNYLNLAHNGTNATIVANAGNIEIGSGGGDFLIGEAGAGVDIHFAESGSIEADATKVITMTDIGTITPDATSTYNLGSTALYWNNLYINNVYSAGSGTSGFWTQQSGALYPTISSVDLLIGGTSTSSAKFAFTNVLTGTPTATFSGNLVLAGGSRTISATNMNNLTLGDSITQNVIINPNSNVGIGTTAPDMKLTVNGDMNIANGNGIVVGHTAQIAISDGGGVTAMTPEAQVIGSNRVDSTLLLATFKDSTANPTYWWETANLAFLKSNTDTIGNSGAVTDTMTLGDITWYAADGNDLKSVAAKIRAQIDGAPGANDTPGALLFLTTADGNEDSSERMRITSGGNVGIGTTNPQAPLHVTGDLYVSDGLSLYENAVSDGTVEAIKFCTGDGETNCVTDFSAVGTNYWTQANGTLYPNISSLDLLIGGTSTSSAKFAFINNLTGTPTATFSGNLVLAATAGTTRTISSTNMNPLAINPSGGNVGIGTTNPAHKLDIYGPPGSVASSLASLQIRAQGDDSWGGGDAALYLYTNRTATDRQWSIAAGSGGASPTTRLRFIDETAGQERMTILDSGNVGIGTTSPISKLHVEGTTAGKALMILNETTGTNDILAASASGATVARIGNDGIMYAPRFTDTANSSYFLDPANAASLNLAGYATISGSLAVGYSSLPSGPGNAVFSGNVGIGTTNPYSKLEVKDQIRISRAGDYYGYVLNNEDSGNRLDIGYMLGVDTWFTNSPIMTLIASGGNVGIGTTAPTSQLNVYGAGQTTAAIADAGLMGGTLWLSDSAQQINSGGAILFGGNTGTQHFFAGIKGLLQDGGTNSAGDLAFSTRNTVADAALTERLRITSGGNVGIGTTNPNSWSGVSGVTGINTQIYSAAAAEARLIINSAASNPELHLVRGANAADDRNYRLIVNANDITLSQPTDNYGANQHLMTWKNDGNVGIGTTSPFAKLTMPTGESNVGNIAWEYASDVNSRRWWMGPDKVVYGDWALMTESSKGLSTPDTYRIYVKNDGNVGIGTTNPGAKLQIGDAVSTTLGINGTQLWLSRTNGTSYSQGINFRTGLAADYIIGRKANSDDLVFGVDGGGGTVSEHIRFTSGGLVGIGTTNPDDKLDVDGDAIFGASAFDSGAVVDIGSASTDYPGNSGWAATWNSNLLLSGLDATTITFHDSGETVGALGHQDNNFWFDGAGSWGPVSLGINDRTPDYTLDVAGTLGVDSDLTVSGTVQSPSGTYMLGSKQGSKRRFEWKASGTSTNYDTWTTYSVTWDNSFNTIIGVTFSCRKTGGTSGVEAEFSSYRGLTYSTTGASVEAYVAGYPGDALYYDTRCEFFALGYDSGGSDFAEYIPLVDPSIEEGDIVVIEPDISVFGVTKSSKPYQKTILGIISTEPGEILNSPEANNPSDLPAKPLALSGRVPVKVSAENGPIAVGDPLTSSSIPGVAMKATKAGQIIGKALEPYANSDPTAVGKILVFINLSWYDPDVYLADTGELQITDSTQITDRLNTDTTDKYSLVKTTGEVINRVGAFGQAVIATLRTGLIQTQELIANNITTSNLTISNKLASPLVETDQLVAKESRFGKILADNVQSNNIATNNITIENDATVAGTLYADEIVTKHGRFGDLIANQITAATVSAQYITYVNNIYQVTGETQQVTSSSTPTPTPELTGLDPVTPTLSEAEGPTPTPDLSLPEATESAALADQALSWPITDVSEDLPVGEAGLRITSNLKVLGRTSLADTTIAGQLLVDGTVVIDSTGINALPSSVLRLQSSGFGGVDILAGKVVIDIDGNVQIVGNLAVGGDLSASSLTLKRSNLPGGSTSEETDGESGFGNLLTVNNPLGETLASIDASGSAYFAQVATQKVIVATAEATPSAELTGPTITTNATAGEATLPAYETEIIIKSPYVTENTLIYVTPISSTENKVLYVKAKQASQQCSNIAIEQCSNEPGWFTVGVDTTINQDIKFNWWIIN